MKRTVEEKYNYNKKRGGHFGSGYCIGVDVYKGYFKQDAENRRQTQRIINNFMQLAKNGDQMSKGIIAGYRDAANERKNGKNRLS